MRFHYLGCLPIGGGCTLLIGLKALGGRTASAGQLVSLVFGLTLAWWIAGIGLIPMLPKAWAGPPQGRARHAARYVFGGAMAMLTACGTVTAVHWVYAGLLGYARPLGDALAAWGAVLGGQAAGCLALRAPSRTGEQLLLAAGIIAGLAGISLMGWFMS